MNAWHEWPVQQVFEALHTSAAGLSFPEAESRRERYGLNELQEQRRRSPLRMLLGQFTETMVLILIAAAVISAFLGKATEAVAISVIVLLFAILGFIQEYRAERAMAALKKLSVPVVRAKREDTIHELSALELVPGDIIFLEAGNAVPADLRIVESVALRIQEAALTGESEPVEKQTEPIPEPDLPLGDRRNMAYLGTAVTYGRGTAVVVETGMRTELGKIATLIQEVKSEQTPLQKRLDQIGKILALAGVVAALLIMGIGLLRNEPLADMFLTAVSVAVAVVPEGLPAVVVISLAIGAQRMLKRNALIRKLPAVETLGSVTVICSDKTGTLTENRMTVTVIDVAGDRLDFQETLHRHQPVLDADSALLNLSQNLPVAVRLTLLAAALCNDAVLRPGSHAGSFHAVGDPTEGALLIAAAQAGLFTGKLQKALPRVDEQPFDSERKRMTTVHRLAGEGELPGYVRSLSEAGTVAFTKGAVDGLLAVTSYVWTADGPVGITPELHSQILTANEELAKAGLRVLGVAFRPLDNTKSSPAGEWEQDLTFVGLVGMIDPPRAAVLPAIRTCRNAGIRTIMITGDHPLTAAAIAHDLGISTDSEVISGAEITRMDEEMVREHVRGISVYARVAPGDKLRIVNALQQQGEIVAMTGDGVNDAPALKKADIGVAMGVTGTDVAKEASDMVLLDDNFTTIVAAVEEGRVIYNNLVRFIKFSLGGNIGKVLVMLGAPLLGISVALQPLQLLWLNLITDGLIGLGLSLEPAEVDTMQHPPRRPKEPILNLPVKIHVSWVGALIAVITLGVGAFFYDPGATGPTIWQTMLFTTLGFSQIGHALGLRATGYSPFSLTANPALTILLLLALVLQLSVIYVPVVNGFFQLTPLLLPFLGLAFVMGVITFLGVKLERRLTQRSERKR